MVSAPRAGSESHHLRLGRLEHRFGEWGGGISEGFVGQLRLVGHLPDAPVGLGIFQALRFEAHGGYGSGLDES